MKLCDSLSDNFRGFARAIKRSRFIGLLPYVIRYDQFSLRPR